MAKQKIKTTEEDYADYRQRIVDTEYENILNLILNIYI